MLWKVALFKLPTCMQDTSPSIGAMWVFTLDSYVVYIVSLVGGTLILCSLNRFFIISWVFVGITILTQHKNMSRDFKVCSLEIERFQSQNPSRADKAAQQHAPKTRLLLSVSSLRSKALKPYLGNLGGWNNRPFLPHGWKTWFQMPTIEKGGL